MTQPGLYHAHLRLLSRTQSQLAGHIFPPVCQLFLSFYYIIIIIICKSYLTPTFLNSSIEIIQAHDIYLKWHFHPD